ncbi:hypothetical protein F511_41826 [Dorcoceras hygrometricum]|uniref:Uncharacterized protein n=1 Tax=Dorcoceras hygrometricum TaxID=472368 RepID=A0A2Z7B557_9LAMI|nr:hypothetical protein F511_41826 [Dorcoceras hygrometricum]
MASLHDNLVVLQEFLQNFPGNRGNTIKALEDRIRDVTRQAKNIIQSHVSKKDAARDEEQYDVFKLCVDQVDLIVVEATKMMEIPEKEDHLPAAETLSRASVGKESMVGLDEDLIQIKDRVVGDEQTLQIIPITGMGGIVRRAFPDDYNGSRVIITTRLSEVALNIDSEIGLHRMQLLDENRSWALFRQKVYANKHPPKHMEEIGQSIARKCKGLPLAIVVMAGVLKANMTREYWENMAENLKSCFLYMGLFPEDYEIPVKKLIKLWVADGFLEPSDESRSLEELAEECLEDLVERSLVLVAGKRSNGRMRSCKIHDVLRDLSITKGLEQRFLHPFTYKDRDRTTLSKLVKSQCRFASIRVLDALLVTSNIFPNEIFKLVNLTYLAFTYNKSHECMISPSISKLQNLQTLIIERGCLPTDYMCKVILPFEIWKMPRLRHLVLMRNTYLKFPYHDGLHGTYSALENLQTLSNVMNFKFTKEAVEGFPNLRKLRFQYNSIEPKQWAKFGLSNLVYLQELDELNFRFYAGSSHVNNHPLPTNLAFPQKLKKLTLTRSGIPWEKMSMVGSLPNLEVLKLMKHSFVGDEWEPTEGEFVVLKYLEIESTDLREWRVESDHFPCLETLIIRWCYKLNDVPSSIGDIPTLEKLTIQTCNVEAEDSVREIEAEQRSLGNHVLRVRIFFPSKRRIDNLSQQRRQNQNGGRTRAEPHSTGTVVNSREVEDDYAGSIRGLFQFHP